jgi:Fur family ferric uptake transcriptional regulator
MMQIHCKGRPPRAMAPEIMPITEDLKDTGLRVTAPRIKILELFQRSERVHLSAEEVHRQLVLADADVGLATVYRVLAQFEQAGLLSRSHFESGKSVYELNEGEHHDHLVCIDCGHVEEFVDPEIEKRQRAVAKQRGFDLADHALSLYAHCNKSDCPHRH